MEVFFKILYFLCLLSASIGLQLAPLINIKTPIGLGLQIGGTNTNQLKNIDSNNNRPIYPKQCFCVPSNANSRPVISYLYPRHEHLERIVVYLYKTDGIVRVYIPNKNKQELIPELNFDDNEGDILIPVSSETIVELFDPTIIHPQQTVVTYSEEILNESEIMDMEINKPMPVNVNIDSDSHLIDNIDYPSVIISDDNSSQEEVNFFDIQDISIPIDEQNIPIADILNLSSQTQSVPITNPELNEITNLPYEQSSEEFIVVDNQELDIIPDVNDSHQLPPNLPVTISQGGGNTQIPDLEDYDELQKIFSLVPPKSQAIQPNPYSTDPKINGYITFDDWFEGQLNHVLLYNLQTTSKIIELRERIKKILGENGMHFSISGIITDSNGNLVWMNNIKLRPILIGSQIDPQNFLGHQTNVADSTISYVQFIEIILANPPKLLGTIMMGTVYLPRKVNLGQKVNLWNNPQVENIVHTDHPVGCITCKPKFPQGHYPLINGLHYPPIIAPVGHYYGLPFRRNFNTEKQKSRNELPHNEHIITNGEPKRRVSEDVNKSGLGDVFDGLLENLGIAPTLITNPTRRLLGGALPKGPKPGPQTYGNDVLPGFRIVGGNAATSSGTPLVNKGRSGFQKPPLII